MTGKEMLKRIEEIKEKYEDEYDYIGIRFEDKERTLGEVIEDYSKSNADRADERDFPEYGTEEYEEMDELDGVSAWNINNAWGWNYNHYIENAADVERKYLTDHCYLIGSDDIEHGEDNNEIIMIDAVVLDILF